MLLEIWLVYDPWSCGMRSSVLNKNVALAFWRAEPTGGISNPSPFSFFSFLFSFAHYAIMLSQWILGIPWREITRRASIISSPGYIVRS